jgi:hypothetical protein
MENFANFIVDYIEKTEIHGVKGWLNQLNAYEWGSERYPDAILTTKNFFNDTKRILSISDNEKLWHQHCKDIRDWGGMIFKVEPPLASILKKSVIYLSDFKYSANCDYSKLPVCGNRIATASKIFYFSDPLRWTIYDSRVGFALHQLIFEYAKVKGVVPATLFQDVPFCLPDSQTKKPHSNEKRRNPVFKTSYCNSEERARASFIWTSHLHRKISDLLNEKPIPKPAHSLSIEPKWELPHVEMVFFVIGDRKWVDAPDFIVQATSRAESQKGGERTDLQQRSNHTIDFSFNDAYQLLQQFGPAHVISSRGTKYTIEAWTMRNGDPVIRAKPGSGVIYIHHDCWGKDITCQGTRAGGIYNGEKNIFVWLKEQKAE